MTALTTTGFSPMAAFRPPRVVGLDDQTQDLLNGMLRQWAAKVPRNIERLLYLDGKNLLKDLKVSLPPEMVDSLNVVMGWPEKAVFELANRIVWERAMVPSGEQDPFGLRRLLRRNRFLVEFPQAVASSLAQSVAFATTTPGDVEAREPETLIMFHSALWATGAWDRRRRELKAGLLINDTDDFGHPTRLTILLPGETVVCLKGAGGWYVDWARPHRLGRVPMEHLPFRPTLDRPFGRARIDRRVISLTDRAVRTGARLDVHSELFSAMKLLLLGVEDEAFKDESGRMLPLWEWYMGRFNTLSRDEDGELPELHQIRAESPEPHIATMRQLASEFSGHTGVPLGALGVAMDNPESADAKTVAREDNITEAEKQQLIYGEALQRIFENAVMIRDGLSEPPAEMAEMTQKWRRPDRPTMVAIADAGTKQLAALPPLAETEVGMELVGLDPEQIDRVRSEFRRTRARLAMEALRDQPDSSGSDESQDEAQELRTRFDALGVAIRAGVQPEDAARRLGLEGIKFTGAIPVALRVPERESERLEER